MADKITTLHPRGNPSTNIYPNIVEENIPSGAVTIDKLGFHLYENYIQVESDNNPEQNTFFITLITTTPITGGYDGVFAQLSKDAFISASGLWNDEPISSIVRVNDVDTIYIQTNGTDRQYTLTGQDPFGVYVHTKEIF